MKFNQYRPNLKYIENNMIDFDKQRRGQGVNTICEVSLECTALDIIIKVILLPLMRYACDYS